MWDSDDDGVNDKDEIEACTSPVHPSSRSNFASSSLDLAKFKAATGASGVTVKYPDRFLFGEGAWTIEAWFQRGADLDGDLFRYESYNADSFRLGIENGYPVGAIFNTGGDLIRVGGEMNVDGPDMARLAEGEWNHLALVWAPEQHSLRLYVNGISMVARQTLTKPLIGAGEAFIGKGLDDGYLDEIRIWGEARSEAEIDRWLNEVIPTRDTINTGRYSAMLYNQLAGMPGVVPAPPFSPGRNIND